VKLKNKQTKALKLSTLTGFCFYTVLGCVYDMSTTFGIRIPTTGEVIEVAFRTHYVRWENPLAHLLPDETKVEPLDNSAQGIYTIGDIRKAIAENAH